MRKHVLMAIAIVLVVMSVLVLLAEIEIENTRKSYEKVDDAWFALTAKTFNDEANQAASAFEKLMSNDENISPEERHNCLVQLSQIDNGYYLNEYLDPDALGVVSSECSYFEHIKFMPDPLDIEDYLLLFGISFIFGGLYFYFPSTWKHLSEKDRKVKEQIIAGEKPRKIFWSYFSYESILLLKAELILGAMTFLGYLLYWFNSKKEIDFLKHLIVGEIVALIGVFLFLTISSSVICLIKTKKMLKQTV